MRATQKEIVMYALYLCGGNSRFIDTEDIAIKANELAPGRFSWRKYPEHIDKEVVRTYLNDIRRNEKYVTGSGRKGWTLSTKGAKWISENVHDIDKKKMDWGGEKPVGGSVDSRRASRELSRFRHLSAWSSWDNGNGDMSIREAREVFRLDSYADKELTLMKIARLRNLFVSDKSIDKFLEAAEMVVLKEVD